ncbi:MAG: alcohol dehydrogenase catalytic domain-containing protein [Bacteroidales bacterium]|nr:alcohol dehydrogenase catalytic domain-containing protein [Bacteroidales bacterium]
MDSSKTFEKNSLRFNPVKSTRMRAAVIVSPGKIEFDQIPIPTPGENEVLVRIEGCGICGSDFPVWEGRSWFNYPAQPGAPGHEGFGYIAGVGNKVDNLNIGDRIAMLSYHAYAEYDIADAAQVVKLPDYLSAMPFPGEPLGCAMNIFNRSQISKSDIVAVVGAGFIGNLLIQLSKSAGAKVIALSRRESSLKMAFESGADYIIPLDEHQKVIQKINEITNFQGCTSVIEATGKQWPLDIAGEITGIRGRLIIAGFHQDGMRQVNLQNWNWKGLDVINAHERDPHVYINGIKQAMEAVKNQHINPLKLFTHQYGFEQINTAFQEMASGKTVF